MNIICFGQQPSGFFPKRFFAAKIMAARRLQEEIGGKIVWFCHDSDSDYRETITPLRDKNTGAEARLNFLQENKIQKKHSPLYAKRVPNGWKEEVLKQLPRFVDEKLINIFTSVNEAAVADFCLKMYEKMGLLGGIEALRSGEKNFRQEAPDLENNFFADVKYQNEIVRAKFRDGALSLHEGGGKYTQLPTQTVEKIQKSPGADQRFSWMNAVIKCTHYIYGEGEKQYLKFDQFPGVTFLEREKINDPGFAWIP